MAVVISPEFLSGVAFGVVMFLLALVAVWQNRRRGEESTTTPSHTTSLSHILSMYHPSTSSGPVLPYYHHNGPNVSSPSMPAYPWQIWPHLFPTPSSIPGLSDWAFAFATPTIIQLPSEIDIDMHRPSLFEHYLPVLRLPTSTEEPSSMVPPQITEAEEEEE